MGEGRPRADSRQFGRLRFFRDRRSNWPGYARNFDVNDLPIPDDAGLVEPSHVVLGGGGLIAAEYNHFGPRIPTQFASLLRHKLGMSVRIGTYVQGDILDQHGTQHQPGTPIAKQRALLELQLTKQAELAYQRLIQDWKATGNDTPSPSVTP